MKYAIEIEHLSKKYGKQYGVKDLSLKVTAGDIYAFIGPNGAGKSTTIRSMLGLIDYEGSIQILGMEAKTNREKILEQIGYLPSEAMFYPTMKVKDVIRFAADMRKKDCREEASRLCERLKLDGNKKIESLSLGNRKKVGIVCAMQHKPDLFIFDEPTSGLDPLMQAEFFQLVQEYNQAGTTCFLSSHVLPEVKKYCNQMAIIKEGHLIGSNSVEYFTKTNVKRVRLVKDGIKEDFVYRGNLDELFASFIGHHIEDILIEEPELDEIFRHFYEEEAK